MSRASLVRCAVLMALAMPAGCKSKGGSDRRDAGPVVRKPLVAIESEPNDSGATATPIFHGKPIRGQLTARGKKKDRDYYRIESKVPNGRLHAVLTGVPGLDLSLTVSRVKPEKVLLRVDNAGKGKGETVTNVGVGLGEYLVVVGQVGRKALTSEMPYTLTVYVQPAGAGDELEPNNVKVDAQPMAPAQAIQGYFGHRKDSDWYKLSLPDTRGDFVLRVEMTAVPGILGASLKILDEIEAVLKRGALSRRRGILFPNLYIKPNQRVLYLVAYGGRRFNVKERYTLQATLQKLRGAAEHEPNDRYPLATPIASGQRIKGYIAPAGDVDWYLVEAARKSIAKVTVTGVDDVDLVLSAHDGSGKKIVSVDEGNKREGEIIANAAISPGKMLIRVQATRKSQENVFQTYELVAEIRDDSGLEEREPNGEIAQANPIAVGQAREGMIYPRKDIDHYRFEVGPSEGPRQIRISVGGISKVPLRLAILDASGKELAHDGPKMPHEGAKLDQQLQPGRYFIKVSGGKASNPRDRYRLRVWTR